MKVIIEKEFFLIETRHSVRYDSPVRGMMEESLISRTKYGPYKNKTTALKKQEGKIKKYKKLGYKLFSRPRPQNIPCVQLTHDWRSGQPRLNGEVENIYFFIEEAIISEKPLP